MNDRELLPDNIKEMSLSKEEIVLDYLDSLKALDFFKELGYAALGFEMIQRNKDQSLSEIQAYVSDFPEHIDWDNFVNLSYNQVKDQLTKTFHALRFGEIDEETVYFGLNFLNKDEFEDYYYEYFPID